MKEYSKIYCSLYLLCTSFMTYGQTEYRQYQPVQMDFEIATTDEIAAENPFTDYRLQVRFIQGDRVFSVPGFYAADGKASETGASSGGVWKVLFTPDQKGIWRYEVSFRRGNNIAVDDDPYIGAAVPPHNGKKGTIEVKSPDNDDFFSTRGRLQYKNSRYLHTQDGRPLLKIGTNSPENFLAFEDIDGTYSYDPEKRFLKKWEAHKKDWNEGDPVWQGTKGKGIIGALNYLASKGMNSVYALTLNIEGDAKDVWPFISHEKKHFKRYDVSKLDQWDIIFSHAEKQGIIMHLVTQEKENELILDDGYTEDERKLYYRELIARFGYHQNIIWNMGEENGSAPWWPQGQSDQQRFSMIRYLKDHDPYQNPILIHTLPEEEQRKPIVEKLVGFDKLDGLSMQISNILDIHKDVKHWINASKKSKRPWIVSMDEIGPWHTGTPTDETNTRKDSLRTHVLWSTLMAGGSGVEWYFGWLKPPHDLNAEDWRSRNAVWEESQIARNFFETLPYTEMESIDHMVKGESTYCFGKEGSLYAIYLGNGGSTQLNLANQEGNFQVFWFDPRTGGELQKGSVKSIEGGRISNIGDPPNEPEKDWVVHISVIKN